MFSAQLYARTLSELEPGQSVEEVIRYMKVKGHESLLPHVVRILERTKMSDEVLLTVARKEDAETFKEKIQIVGAHASTPVEVVVDSGLVGGFTVRKGQHFCDASFRRALITLYNNVTGKKMYG